MLIESFLSSRCSKPMALSLPDLAVSAGLLLPLGLLPCCCALPKMDANNSTQIMILYFIKACLQLCNKFFKYIRKFRFGVLCGLQYFFVSDHVLFTAYTDVGYYAHSKNW